jgi:hypothetical protein
LTTDATWRDLDLSAIVPTNARAVLLRVDVNDGTPAALVQFRKNGNVNVAAASIVEVAVANISATQNVIVACSNAVIEYYGTNTTFTAINIVVLGWWL